MTDEWITKRRPTKEDEDEKGEVLMQRFPDGRPSSFNGETMARVAAVHVGGGIPWKRTPFWRPPNTPEPEPEAPKPAPKPELRVGQVWRRGDGCLMTVMSVDRGRFRVADNNGLSFAYCPDGSGISLSPGMDLVELITDAPAKPATRKVPRLFAEPPRRTFSPSGVTCWDALADDGTAWHRHPRDPQWTQHPLLPDREEPIDA